MELSRAKREAVSWRSNSPSAYSIASGRNACTNKLKERADWIEERLFRALQSAVRGKVKVRLFESGGQFSSLVESLLREWIDKQK